MRRFFGVGSGAKAPGEGAPAIGGEDAAANPLRRAQPPTTGENSPDAKFLADLANILAAEEEEKQQKAKEEAEEAERKKSKEEERLILSQQLQQQQQEEDDEVKEGGFVNGDGGAQHVQAVVEGSHVEDSHGNLSTTSGGDNNVDGSALVAATNNFGKTNDSSIDADDGLSVNSSLPSRHESPTNSAADEGPNSDDELNQMKTPKRGNKIIDLNESAASEGVLDTISSDYDAEDAKKHGDDTDDFYSLGDDHLSFQSVEELVPHAVNHLMNEGDASDKTSDIANVATSTEEPANEADEVDNANHILDGLTALLDDLLNVSEASGTADTSDASLSELLRVSADNSVITADENDFEPADKTVPQGEGAALDDVQSAFYPPPTPTPQHTSQNEVDIYPVPQHTNTDTTMDSTDTIPINNTTLLRLPAALSGMKEGAPWEKAETTQDSEELSREVGIKSPIHLGEGRIIKPTPEGNMSAERAGGTGEVNCDQESLVENNNRYPDTTENGPIHDPSHPAASDKEEGNDHAELESLEREPIVVAATADQMPQAESRASDNNDTSAEHSAADVKNRMAALHDTNSMGEDTKSLIIPPEVQGTFQSVLLPSDWADVDSGRGQVQPLLVAAEIGSCDTWGRVTEYEGPDGDTEVTCKQSIHESTGSVDEQPSVSLDIKSVPQSTAAEDKHGEQSFVMCVATEEASEGAVGQTGASKGPVSIVCDFDGITPASLTRESERPSETGITPTQQEQEQITIPMNDVVSECCQESDSLVSTEEATGPTVLALSSERSDTGNLGSDDSTKEQTDVFSKAIPLPSQGQNTAEASAQVAASEPFHDNQPERIHTSSQTIQSDGVPSATRPMKVADGSKVALDDHPPNSKAGVPVSPTATICVDTSGGAIPSQNSSLELHRTGESPTPFVDDNFDQVDPSTSSGPTFTTSDGVTMPGPDSSKVSEIGGTELLEAAASPEGVSSELDTALMQCRRIDMDGSVNKAGSIPVDTPKELLVSEPSRPSNLLVHREIFSPPSDVVQDKLADSLEEMAHALTPAENSIAKVPDATFVQNEDRTFGPAESWVGTDDIATTSQTTLAEDDANEPPYCDGRVGDVPEALPGDEQRTLEVAEKSIEHELHFIPTESTAEEAGESFYGQAETRDASETDDAACRAEGLSKTEETILAASSTSDQLETNKASGDVGSRMAGIGIAEALEAEAKELDKMHQPAFGDVDPHPADSLVLSPPALAGDYDEVKADQIRNQSQIAGKVSERDISSTTENAEASHVQLASANNESEHTLDPGRVTNDDDVIEAPTDTRGQVASTSSLVRSGDDRAAEPLPETFQHSNPAVAALDKSDATTEGADHRFDALPGGAVTEMVQDTVLPEEKTEKSSRAADDADSLMDGFTAFRSSFNRLLSATSSTATTVSEVAAPALLEAGQVVKSSAEVAGPAFLEAGSVMKSSASEIVDACRQNIKKRRSEKNLVVAFIQDETKVDMARGQAKTPAEGSCVISRPHVDDETAMELARSSLSDLDQYRKALSQYLSEGVTLAKTVQTAEKASDEVFVDPILQAAEAGASARKRQHLQQLEQQRLRELGVENEWSACFGRLAQYTASAAKTLAAVAAPALKEARIVASELGATGAHLHREEEVVVLSTSAANEARLQQQNSERIMAAQSVRFCNDCSGDLPRPRKRVMGDTWNSLEAPENIPAQTPHKIARDDFAKNWSENERGAWEVPKKVADFLSKKLKHPESSAKEMGPILSQSTDFHAEHSIFVHERKSSDMSSVSSRVSLGGLSTSSASSSSSSGAISKSPSSTTATSLVTATVSADPKWMPFWDMISDGGESTETRTPISEEPRPSVHLTGQRSPHHTALAEESGDVKKDLDNRDQSVFRTMETHVEYPDESEHNGFCDSLTQPVHAEDMARSNFSSINLAPLSGYSSMRSAEASQQDTSEGSLDAIQPVDDGEPETFEWMVTPPQRNVSRQTQAVDTSSTSLGASFSSLAKESRRGQAGVKRTIAEKRRRQCAKLGLKPVRSADETDENDSFTMACQSAESSVHGSLVSDSYIRRDHRLDMSPPGSVHTAPNSTALARSKNRSSYSAPRRRVEKTRSKSSMQNSWRVFSDDTTDALSTQNLTENDSNLVGTSVKTDGLLSPGRSLLFTKMQSLDFDDLSQPNLFMMEGGGILDLALVAFSAAENSTFLKDIAEPQIPAPLRYLASVQWRQITSNWKHATLAKALSDKPTSPHFFYAEDFDLDLIDSDDESSSSSTASAVRARKGKKEVLRLRGDRKLSDMVHRETKNLNGLVPHLADGEMTATTRFIAEFGSWNAPSRTSQASDGAELVHILPRSKNPATARCLVEFLGAYYKQFSVLMRRIVDFASHNHATTEDDTETEVSYSVGVKSISSIETKARRKYGGDVLRVKDVLRAQITCGGEGSLVAALLYLARVCRKGHGSKEGRLSVDVVRVKNLFQRSPAGVLCASPLPTGYRHIIINVRLNNSGIAEIQFQLVKVFEVLGYDGYSLHREILEVEEACVQSYRSPPPSTFGNEKVSANEQAAATDDGEAKIEALDPAKSSQRGNAMETPNSSLKKQPDYITCTEGVDPKPDSIDISGEAPDSTSGGSNSQKKEHPVYGTANPAQIGRVNGAGAPESEVLTVAEYSEDNALDAAKVTLLPANDSDGVLDGTDSSACAREKNNRCDDVSSTYNLFDDEQSRLERLEDLRQKASGYSRAQVLSAIRNYSVDMARRNLRDVPAFYCLHFLSMIETGFTWTNTSVLESFFGNINGIEMWPLFGSSNSRVETVEISPQAVERAENAFAEENTDQRKLDEAFSISKECLLHCLSISNQGTSVGMTGWFEYGAENSFGRIADRPFDTLHQLACTMACSGDWNGAIDVLKSLVMRCEQHLPLYHPITLSSMLDLAGAFMKSANGIQAQRLVEEASRRLAFYLMEQETSFFAPFNVSSTGAKPQAVAVLRFDNGVDEISMLRAFANQFACLLSRGFLRVLDGSEFSLVSDARLVNHCLVGDSLCVLANCMVAAELKFGESADSTAGSQQFWCAAQKHYEAALKGWIKMQRPLNDESVAWAAYGVARCLRELGHREKGLHILSSLVSAIGVDDSVDEDEGPCLVQHYGEIDQEHGQGLGDNENSANTSDNIQKETSRGHAAMVFLPRSPSSTEAANSFILTGDKRTTGGRKEQLLALCLWLMAVFAVEEHPDERGRIRALSLLHAASESLMSVVTTDAHDHADDNPTTASYKQVCLEILRCIEQEAAVLLAPWQKIAEDSPFEAEKPSESGSRTSKFDRQSSWLLEDTPSVPV